jgi:hypothetical protein
MFTKSQLLVEETIRQLRHNDPLWLSVWGIRCGCPYCLHKGNSLVGVYLWLEHVLLKGKIAMKNALVMSIATATVGLACAFMALTLAKDDATAAGLLFGVAGTALGSFLKQPQKAGKSNE